MGSSISTILALEQFMIENLHPDLNVDPIAGGMNGYHTPMSEEMRTQLRKERGTPFYVYDTKLNGLLYILLILFSTLVIHLTFIVELSMSV